MALLGDYHTQVFFSNFVSGGSNLGICVWMVLYWAEQCSQAPQLSCTKKEVEDAGMLVLKQKSKETLQLVAGE